MERSFRIASFIFIGICLSISLQAGTSLTFEQRLDGHKAIERVYYEHRIWPQDNPGRKPPFEELMPEDVLRSKVEDSLRMNAALQERYGVTITGADLQAEIDRMARETQAPAMLNELFAALGNDPRLIAECLARPLLVDRLLRERFAADETFLGSVRARAAVERAAFASPDDMGMAGDVRAEIHYIKQDLHGVPSRDTYTGGYRETPVDVTDWDALTKRFSKEWGAEKAAGPGWISPVREEPDRFSVTAILKSSGDSLWTLTASWMKQPFDLWWAQTAAIFAETLQEPDFAYQIPSINIPQGDSWSATNDVSVNCPTARYQHVATWTGAEMVIWGGINGASYYSTGGRYYPATNAWLTTSQGTNCPSQRTLHTGVWSGSEVLIWSGTNGSNDLDNGGRYDPAANTWQTIASTGLAQVPPRHGHRAIGGGTMLVYGGYFGTQELGHGGTYTVGASNPWEALPTANGPGARADFTFSPGNGDATVWGGDFSNTGAVLDTAHVPPSWSTMTTTGAPTGRSFHTAVFYTDFTGNDKLLIWGGNTGTVTNTGAIYFSGTWTAMSTGANVPAARAGHTAVGDIGNRFMIVWGGMVSGGARTNTGGLYYSTNDTWETISITGAPAARNAHTAVWTGEKMIVWGGLDGSSNPIKTGGVYSPCAVPQVLEGVGQSVTATDLNNCALTGIRVSWADIVALYWDDYDVNPSARSIDILRNGSVIATGLSYTSTSYVDTTAVPNTPYQYRVRFNNSCGTSGTTGLTDPVREHPYSPVLDALNNSAADLNGCADTGVSITWQQNPTDWGDGSTGTRNFMVFRDSTWIGPVLPYSTTNYIDNTGTHGQTYLYKVRYINGCGASYSTMTPGASAADDIGGAPTVTNNNTAADLAGCEDSGVLITWAADPGYDPANWHDGGAEGRHYLILRDGAVIYTLSYGFPTDYTDTTGTNGVSYTYSVRYINGCGASADTAGVAAMDHLPPTWPSGLTNNTAVDLAPCGDTGVQISWVADPASWGDNGVANRTYDIFRNGTEIAIDIPYGTTTYLDTTGVNGTTYTYSVEYNNGCGYIESTTGMAAADSTNGTIYVDDSYDSSTVGWNIDHFASIQPGINAACVGGAMQVAAGSYTESVTLNKNTNVSLSGRVTINGSLTMTAGAWTSTSSTLAVSGDFSNNGGTFNANGGTLLLNGTAGQVLGGNTATTFNNLAVNDSLAGYWKLDDGSGTSASDSSGNGRDGGLNGPTWSATTPPVHFADTGSLSFDGGDLVSAPLATAAVDNVTLSIWTRWAGGLGTSQTIFHNGDVTANGYGIYLEVANGYKICVKRIGVGPLYTASILPSDGSTWENLVLVRRSGTWELYMNGTQLPFTFGDAALGPVVPTTGTYIGNSAAATLGFNGLIDDARIYTRALSTSEITQLAAGNPPTGFTSITALNHALDINGSLTVNSGALDVSVGNYAINVAGNWLHNGGSFVPRSGTMTMDGVTQSITGCPTFNNFTVNAGSTTTLPVGTMTVAGNWTNNNTVAANNGTVVFNGAYGQSIGGTGAPTFNNLTVSTSGLAAYWKLDDATGSTASDSSGNGHDGAISGAVWSAAVAPVAFSDSASLSFDGSGDVVNAPLATTATDNVTLSAWARWAGGLAAGQTIVYNGNSGASGYGLFLDQPSGNKIVALIGGKIIYYTNATLPTDGTWKNVVLVRRSGTWELYVNGVQQGFTNGPATIAPNVPTSGTYIGNTGTLNGSYNGFIDDVRIYNRALSTTEITALGSGGEVAPVTLSRAVDINGSLTLALGALDVTTGNYAVNVAGNWTQNGGAFLPRAGTVYFDGPGTQTITGNTSFFNLNVAASVTLATTFDVAVGGTLTNSGWTQETKGITTTGSKSWGLAAVTTNTTTQGTLSSLQIRRRDQNHPNANPDEQTGKYWIMTPTGSGYAVNLTLAHNNQTDPQACRYNAGAWDCARSSYTSATVIRNGVTAFSDWAVGTHVASPPVGSGKTGTTAATFKKSGTIANQIDVTYDAAHCSSQKAVILYGTIGSYGGYTGCAQVDAGNIGAAIIAAGSMSNVWFNVVWTSGTTGGHPGFAFDGISDIARTWNAAPFCGLSTDNHSDNTCN